jgi:hypothetical protein
MVQKKPLAKHIWPDYIHHWLTEMPATEKWSIEEKTRRQRLATDSRMEKVADMLLSLAAPYHLRRQGGEIVIEVTEDDPTEVLQLVLSYAINLPSIYARFSKNPEEINKKTLKQLALAARQFKQAIEVDPWLITNYLAPAPIKSTSDLHEGIQRRQFLIRIVDTIESEATLGKQYKSPFDIPTMSRKKGVQSAETRYSCRVMVYLFRKLFGRPLYDLVATIVSVSLDCDPPIYHDEVKEYCRLK